MQPLALLPTKLAEPRSLSGALIALTVLAVLLRVITLALRPQLKFIWHAFIAPIGKKSRQKEQLDTVCILSSTLLSPSHIPTPSSLVL